MFEKLRELVFGFGEFEKTKLEIRFEMIFTLLPMLKINTLRDFEILEETLYKLRDQLRVKSSNLNRVIKDPAKSLTKKKVSNLVDTLDNLKYNFLKEAFAVLKPKSNDVGEEIKEVPEEVEIEPNVEVLDDSLEKENLEEDVAYDQKKLDSLELISNDKAEIYLENGKIPYILVKFKEEVDFILLRNLASVLFEVKQVQGTNIIVEKNRALIVPREIDDNLINLPRVEADLEDIYFKLKKDDSQKLKEEKVVEKDDYVKIDEPFKKTKPTLKQKEDSLDELLSGIEKKKPNKDKVFVDREKNDEIEIEKSESIEIEKVEPEIKENEEIIEVEKKSNDSDIFNFELYKDDKIVVYLNEKSQVLGEVIIKSISQKKINELSENDLSYLSLFSKVFASVLFEVMQAQGTNIIWDYEGNTIRIIPRIQEDNLKLNWDPTSNTEEFLEEVRGKLIAHMSKALGDENNVQEAEVKEVSKEPKNIDISKEQDLRNRAKYLLDSIRKIP